MTTTSVRVWTSEVRGSAFVEPVKRDRGSSAAWPTKRAKKHSPRLTDGQKHPVTIRYKEN